MAKIYVEKGIVVTEVRSTQRYMTEIKKYGNLTREEEVDLVEKIQQGDQSALNKLIRSNLRFVVQVAKSYQGMGVELEDLIAFGNIGLYEAISRYDTDKKMKFISYAVWWIRSEIQKSLNDFGRAVRIPSHRTGTEEYSEQSVDVTIGEGEDSESYSDRFLVQPEGKSKFDIEDLTRDLDNALSKLKPKEEVAIRLYYGIGLDWPKSIESIAVMLDLTNERVRQLIRRSEITLRNTSGIELLEKYL